MVFLDMLSKMILGMKWILIITLGTCDCWLSNSLVSSPSVTLDTLLVCGLIIALTTVVSDTRMLRNNVFL